MIQSCFAQFIPQEKKKPLILVVSVILINQNRKVLLQKRPKGKKFSGFWELPGGKVKLYENPEKALIREIKEELNIELKVKDLINFSFVNHEYKDFFLLMLVYKAQEWSKNIKPMDGQEIKFYSDKDLKKIKIIEADLTLVDPLIKLIKI